MASAPILTANELRKEYPVPGGKVKALDGVSLEILEGETVAVVGESGSGKTTLGKLILGIEPATSGHVIFAGKVLTVNRPRTMRRRIQVVQQNPMATLNPRRTIRQTIELPLRVHRLVPQRMYRERVAELLRTVELPPEYMDRYPRALSGGQRQRVAIARALAAQPDLIILDEPTSALDVSVQAKVITLLVDLQRQLKLTYLFITHDLSLVRNIASRVVVMYRGRVVELGETVQLFQAPLHPYTQMLLSSIPVTSKEEEALKPEWPWERQLTVESERDSAGCPFAPRCPFAEQACWVKPPPLIIVRENHHSACHMVSGEIPNKLVKP